MLDTTPNHRLETATTGTWRQSRSAPQPCSACWVVAQTNPQAERWAASELQRRGYRTYLPLLAVKRRDRATHRMMHVVCIPLFPGYLFVQLAPSDPWSPVRYAPGVAALLMACGRPEQVRAGLVETLQAGEDARRHVVAATANWAPGTPCRLTAGPFEGRDAVVIALVQSNAFGPAVRVALPMFGAMREVEAPTEWLEARS